MSLRKIKVILGVLAVLSAVMLTAIFLFREPIKQTVNAYRADRLYLKAKASFEADDWQQASRSAQAGHYLDPEHEDLQLLLAKALLKQRSPNTLFWWRKVVDHPEIPAEQLKILTDAAIQGEELSTALLFLERLFELEPNDPELHALWIKLLSRQKRYASARQFAVQQEMKGASPASLSQTRIRLAGKSLEERGRYLLELVQKDGPLAHSAARLLLETGVGDSTTQLAAARFLSENPRNPVDRLYADYTLHRGESAEAFAPPAITDLEGVTTEGRLEEIAEWASWAGQASWFLGEIPWETFKASGADTDIYMNLLLEAERYAQIIELVYKERQSSDTAGPILLYYRSLAQKELGEDQRAEETLRLAVETSGPVNAEFLEDKLTILQRWDLLGQLFEQRIARESESSEMALKLLATYYLQGQTYDIFLLLESLRDVELIDQPLWQSLHLYLKVMTSSEPQDAHEQMERLFTQYPEVNEYRLVLALSYSFQGRHDIASELVEAMNPVPPSAFRHLRITAALLGMGDARLVLETAGGNLLPREQQLLRNAIRKAS